MYRHPKSAPLFLSVIALLAMTALPAAAGEIHRAVEAGDADLVATLIGADPGLVSAQDTDQFRELPLHVAAAHGQVDIARLLLDAGAQVDAGDSDLSTPLHVAAVRGQLAMVNLLIDRGADLAFQDNNGAWSMSFAVSRNDTTIIERIMEAGAPLDLVTANGTTLVHMAASRGRTDLFARFVDAGISPDSANEDGMTPLHYAAMGGRTDMITLLLDRGASIDLADQHGNTALMQAAWRGRTEAASALVSAGADVNVVDDWERTSLWIAAAEGQLPLVAALLGAGADVNRADLFGRTPLHRAVGDGNADIVRALITARANPDLRESRCGRTPLQVAALSGYGDIVEILAAGGASVRARDGHGQSALDLALAGSHETSAKALQARGAEIDEDADPCPAATGCLIACPGERPAEETILAEGDARIWYMGHSGYAVQTRNNLLVFDYWERGRAADEPALVNGHIDPAEIKDMKVTVFVSHEHGDHFDPTIFEWADQVESIRYVMGCPAETTVPYDLLEPRTVHDFDGVTVRTIESNDSGLGFLVDCDGVQIYHAGDHANRLRDFTGPYCGEINWLAAAGARPDIALMPVSGCGFGDQVAVKMGVEFALEKLQPKIFVPLHAGSNEWRYEEFVNSIRNKHLGVLMLAPTHKGDHHDYRGGKIS
ncbi:MAG: hypothetical protein GY838_19470 [bacterium]|nr:hypothetical protein [bacterium]